MSSFYHASFGRFVDSDSPIEVTPCLPAMGSSNGVTYRHRGVVRKNQEVIDAHEKALNDAR